jgi:hypothetical protein
MRVQAFEFHEAVSVKCPGCGFAEEVEVYY